MSKENTLTILCGLPASGKSTYAQNLVDCGYAERVCPDEIRKELYGDESIQGNGKKVFEIAYSRVREIGERGKNCVFDATQTSKKARAETLRKCGQYFAKVDCVYVYASLETAYDRNKKRERQVPEEVIYRMYRSFKEPSADEGFREIIKIMS